MTRPPLLTGALAAAAGGALGGLARWLLVLAAPTAVGDLPWVVVAINVSGSALLAALPLLRVVRRAPLLGVFLGTGVLGGYTTMSAASVDAVVLAQAGRPAAATAYVVVTLAAALLAVALVRRLVPPPPEAER